MKFRHLSCLLFFICSVSQQLQADQFHYHNFLIGDRALGLGGSYNALSDDSSGVYYNPAGIAFAKNNDISGSANAIYTQKITYKETIAEQDFVEKSNGNVPVFFGGLQKLDNFLPGLAFAFGVFVDDSELKDQNDLISDVALDKNSPCQPGVNSSSDYLERYHRTASQRAATAHYSAALGWRVIPSLSIGVGLDVVDIDELLLSYQDLTLKRSICTVGIASGKSILQTQSARQSLVGRGILPSVAIRAELKENLSWGLTVKLGRYLSQHFTESVETRVIDVDSTDQAAVHPTADSREVVTTHAAGIKVANGDLDISKPLGSPPVIIGTGFAYSPIPSLLIAVDGTYHTAVTDADPLYQKDAVFDYSLGLEYFVLDSLPVRFGFFTNHDSRPKLNKIDLGQRDHIDYYGESLFLSWLRSKNQIGLGVVFQQGSGEAQKLSENVAIQKVRAQSFVFAFSATRIL